MGKREKRRLTRQRGKGHQRRTARPFPAHAVVGKHEDFKSRFARRDDPCLGSWPGPPGRKLPLTGGGSSRESYPKKIIESFFAFCRKGVRSMRSTCGSEWANSGRSLRSYTQLACSPG